MLAFVVCSEFHALTLEVGLFCVCLRMYRHKLTRSHRHSPGDQAGDPGDLPWAAATPSTRLAVERMPSFAPNTAARSHPMWPV
jgi:hypothetical protein